MISVHVNVEDAQNNLQKDYNSVLQWSHDKGLRINENKTKLLTISTSKRCVSGVRILSHNYGCLHGELFEMGGCTCNAIEEVRSFKYLGMYIDDRFSWVVHINKVSKSLRGCLAQIYRLQFCVDGKILKMVYHALVQSIIGYGLQCYGNSAATHLRKIEMVNKKIIKIINGRTMPPHGTRGNIYQNTCMLPVDKLYKYMMIIENYYNLQYLKEPEHMYNLRHTRLNIPMTFNRYGEKQNKVEIPRILNSIPHDMKEIKKIGKVKQVIKRWLLDKT